MKNNKKGMHPVRQQVRAVLEEMNIYLENDNYYSDYPISVYGYLIYLLPHIGSPPTFNTVDNYSLPNITKRLNEFYNEANIEYLYGKYTGEYQTAIEEFEENVYPIVQKTVNHFNLDWYPIQGA
jgi:hypothetical protein